MIHAPQSVKSHLGLDQFITSICNCMRSMFIFFALQRCIYFPDASKFSMNYFLRKKMDELKIRNWNHDKLSLTYTFYIAVVPLLIAKFSN